MASIIDNAVGVDVGGTFTDFLFLIDNKYTVQKIPTTPDDPSIGILEGIRTGTTFANSITDLTYLFPVECDICLPLKFIISFVIIPTIGLDAI